MQNLNEKTLSFEIFIYQVKLRSFKFQKIIIHQVINKKNFVDSFLVQVLVDIAK